MEAEENNGENEDPEEDDAQRRNQVMMFSLIIIAVISIVFALSDFDYMDAAYFSEMPMKVSEDVPAPPVRAIETNNLTNLSSKNFFKNPEDSVENRILRNIAIHKAIRDIDPNLSETAEMQEKTDDDLVQQIVESFMETEEFQYMITDIEIMDVIKKLREQKGYKKRENTIFEDLFQQIEKQLVSEDPRQLQLIRRVGEELEKRAREIILHRRSKGPRDLSPEETETITNEIFINI